MIEVMRAMIKSAIILIITPTLILLMLIAIYQIYKRLQNNKKEFSFICKGERYRAIKWDGYYRITWNDRGHNISVLYPTRAVKNYLKSGYWRITNG